LSTTSLRRRLLPALALSITVGLTAGVTAPAPALAAEPEAAQRAAAWLAGALTDAGTVVGSFTGTDGQPSVFTDYGRTLDAGLALLVAGGHDDVLGRTLTSATSPTAVRAYTQGAPFDAAGAVYAGATAKLAFFVEAAGGDATRVGGVDLLSQLDSRIGANGRLSDRSDFGDFANVFGQAFAILAFDTAGRSNERTQSLVTGLSQVQCADGSFPEMFVPKAGTSCTGSVDATGLVLQALAAVDQAGSEDARQAAAWLQGQQEDDGSFPGEAPVNSTGYAAMGLAAVGVDVRAASRYLAAQQNTDGGLRRGPAAGASDLFATAQALPALLDRTFVSGIRTVASQSIPCRTAVTTVAQKTITATGSAVVTVAASSGTTVELLAYSRPSTQYRVVRTLTVGSDRRASTAVKPGTNTRLYARQVGCAEGASVVVEVRPLLTLAAKRNGTRDYTFSGRAIPARAGGFVVALYRVTPEGKEVLTAHARTTSTGTFTIRRTFSGSGRFGFLVRTGRDIQNAAGASAVRPTLVN
jgi:hypothetical protein